MPNPSAFFNSTQEQWIFKTLKVKKEKFDAVLQRLLKTTPKPRKKIKTNGRHGSKQPLLKK